jgi:hypothetical protein
MFCNMFEHYTSPIIGIFKGYMNPNKNIATNEFIKRNDQNITHLDDFNII